MAPAPARSKSKTKQGLYDPQFEHDSCGVGLVANLNGERTHLIVNQALEILENLEHRGALGADPETGDGAGILIELPDALFREELSVKNIDLPPQGKYGVGMFFLPQDPVKRNVCTVALERIVSEKNLTFLGWRDVPHNADTVGVGARAVLPSIMQCFITGPNLSDSELEQRLYVVRRAFEKTVKLENIEDPGEPYVSTLSTNRIVYKGLLIPRQLRKFYNDLTDERVSSRFALVHSRFSTNTLGAWSLAHPYRHVCHNGEINTLRGNINWMTARQAVFESPDLNDELETLFPICLPNQSDTATFDNALELLLNTGRSLPHCMMMMIPEAFENHESMDQERREFYDYHSSLMEPWDGPAMVAATDGRQLAVVLDRNGLRPLRYMVTKNGVVVMGSETGVLNIPPEDIKELGRVRPGRLFLIDIDQIVSG